MIGWRFEFGTLSDLSATIFSVFLLLLVLLADTAGVPRPAAGDPGRAAAVVERAPLGAAAMADLLYGRRLDAAGTRIDVTAGRITMVTPARTLLLAPQALAGPLRAGQVPEPVSLYVFDNQSYAPVAMALRAHGRAWREMSVPAALRGSGPDGDGWSADFRALLDGSKTRDVFVRELAFILGGGEKHNDSISLRNAGRLHSADAGLYGRISGYIASFWTHVPVDAILRLLIGAFGIGVIAVVERRLRVRVS